jgi:carbon-monoxide dehydrogenase small subunit
MSVLPFVESHPNPSREEIKEAIDGNFCRCTGYENIIEAVKLASEKMSKR